MGWDKLADNAGQEWLDIDATNREVNELMESEAWKDEEEKTHPLQDQVEKSSAASIAARTPASSYGVLWQRLPPSLRAHSPGTWTK